MYGEFKKIIPHSLVSFTLYMANIFETVFSNCSNI